MLCASPHPLFQPLALLLPAAALLAPTTARYEPNWESLDARPLPPWYDEAKIGIILHWGIFSVPAWGTTGSMGTGGEWYWWYLRGGDGYVGYEGTPPRLRGPKPCLPATKTAAKLGYCPPDSAYGAFHNRTYGPDFTYAEFAPMFTAELFDPDAWASLFKRAGARYVAVTTKHHEGWANWCSAEAWNWNSCTTGPRRDLVGDLTASVRSAGMRMGLYYSIFEWCE